MSNRNSDSSPKIGLIRFPGSNCDADCIDTFSRHFGITLTVIAHTEESLPRLDGLIIPGGFSYGDYLRAGALASKAKVMSAVKSFAGQGKAIIGICNGFQVLTESGLLPGALLRNDHRKFICKRAKLKVAAGNSGYHQGLTPGSILDIPIAHGDGRYYADDRQYQALLDKGQVLFQYCDEDGQISSESNPNGSVGNIAGIVSENGRILGLMPHPERATDTLVGGGAQGLDIFRSFLASVL